MDALYIIYLFVEELLRQLSTLLDQLLDSDENLLKEWANPELLLVICEASKQCRYI